MAINGDQFNTPTYQWQKSEDEGNSWQNIDGATESSYSTTDFTEGLNYFRYLTANSTANLSSPTCRINSDTKILFVMPTQFTLTDTICDGLTYQFGNQTLNQSGVYIDSLTNFFGCDSIVTLNLTVNNVPPLAPVITINQRICEEDPLPSISIDEVVNGFPPYQISFNGEAPDTITQFTNLDAGTYEIMIEDRFNCTYQNQFEIDPLELFTLDIGEDQHVILGELLQIFPTSNFSISNYAWNPDSLCNLNCENPIFYPTDSVVVSLTATSSLGCITTDQLTITVDKSRFLFMPSAFSPNDDGQNDFFTAKALTPNVLLIQQLQIFDRWGHLVFDKSNFQPNVLNEGWDGTENGKQLPIGVYPYQAKVLFLDGEVITYQGSILLLR